MKNHLGFTFIELMFTISLMGIIVSLAAPMMLASRYRTELLTEVLTFESMIRKINTMAITGEMTDGAGGVPTYGFGLNINSSGEIQMFTNIYDESKYQYEAGSDEDYESNELSGYYKLNSKVSILDFEDSQGHTIPSSYGANIIYIPPEGSIELTDNRGLSVSSFDYEMNIYFKHEDADQCYQFKINKVTGRYFKSIVSCP